MGVYCKQLKRHAWSIREDRGCREVTVNSPQLFLPSFSSTKQLVQREAVVCCRSRKQKAVLYPRGTLPATPAAVRGGGKYSLRTETTRVCLQRFLKEISQHPLLPGLAGRPGTAFIGPSSGRFFAGRVG